MIEQERKDFSLPEYTRYFVYKLNELVQFRGHVYKCVTPVLCGNPDTLPGTNEASKVWLDITLAYNPNTSCRGNSEQDNVGGSTVDSWVANYPYSFGNRVIHNGRLYECESFPNGQFCALGAYKPGSSKGLIAWKDITCKDLSRESAPVQG